MSSEQISQTLSTVLFAWPGTRRHSARFFSCTIIINVRYETEEDREGSILDMNQLSRRTLNLLDTTVESLENSGKSEMLSWLSGFAPSVAAGLYRYVLVFILSHGHRDGRIICADGAVATIDEIRRIFRSVVGGGGDGSDGGDGDGDTGAAVPVVFFVNACRGRQFPLMLKTDGPCRDGGGGDGDDDDGRVKEGGGVRCHVATWYSTREGQTSFRLVKEGSIFVQSLCKVFRDHLASEEEEEEEEEKEEEEENASITLKEALHEVNREMVERGRLGETGKAMTADGNSYRFVQVSDFDPGDLVADLRLRRRRRRRKKKKDGPDKPVKVSP